MPKKENQDREQELIQLARRKAQAYLRAANVTSVGIGYKVKNGKKTKQLCIQFTVERKLSPQELKAQKVEPLPKSITDERGFEVPIDVIQRSYRPGFRLTPERSEMTVRQQRRRRMNPVMPGISVAHPEETAGTLGAIVYDEETGEPYILSNWHVLHGPRGKLGDRALQPGPMDGGGVSKSAAGRLVRSHLGLAGDCAVASLTDRGSDPQVLQLNVTPGRPAKASIGDKVVKSGRTTGVTYGIVERIGVTVRLDYGGPVGTREIGGFEIRPNPDKQAADNEISMGGDSGSLWLIDDEQDGDVAVGLHFAGETDPAPDSEHALACNIHSVLDKLAVSLDPRVASQSECALLRRHILVAERIQGRDPSPEQEDGIAGEVLTGKQLEQLESMMEHSPEELCQRFRQLVDLELSEEELLSGLQECRNFVERPHSMRSSLEARAALEASSALPAEFTFPGMDERIPIRPNSRKFEQYGDLFRWIAFAGGPIIGGYDKAPFRSGDYEYQLNEPGQNDPVEIALFGDFGTGEYHSLYIAKQLRENKFPYAIHLGDVYYAGSHNEFRRHMREPLEPVFQSTEFFLLNANHEMYRGGQSYFGFLDDKRASHPSSQRQEGSCFCLRSQRFQIIGLDTAYHRDGRFQDPTLQEWLVRKLTEGKSNGQTTILLSANHPYRYGERQLTDLYRRDLRDILSDQVDLWFWGNTHYCALFNRGSRTPFIGSCVGHGGFPYGRQRLGKPLPAPLSFLEVTARFPKWTRVRQDRGNNGYCVLSLHQDGSAGLRYMDWMGNQRCVAHLIQSDQHRRLEISEVQVQPLSSFG